MRYLRKWQLAVVCLLALALLPFAPAPHGTAQAPGYTLTDLGTLGGGAGLSSMGYGLDECGRVVGESQAVAGASAPFRPFLWENGVMTDLGTLGGPGGAANALNQSGTIVGSALTAGGLKHPFNRPTGGPMQDLGTLPGGNSAEAYDVNASGQVVGVSEEGALQDRAFIWQSGTMQGITATWGKPIRAFGINDAGQVAGVANLTTTGTHAFITIGGVPVDLGTLGGPVSVATEVNDSGAVIGYAHITTPPNSISQFFRAFLWKDLNGNGQSDAGEMLDLGHLSPTHKNSFAFDINSAGVVVGASETGTGSTNVSRAFIWQDFNGNGQSDAGDLQDLNDVVTGTNWTFQEAHAINDRGQIVGTGLNPDGKVHAFLLTPTNVGPSPCDPTPTPTPVPGTLQFSAPTYTVGEGGGAVVISVSRTGGDDGSVTVNYATSNGTATAGVGNDYLAASGTLTFLDGETTKTFSVTINDDTLDEEDETVNLTLSTPGGGATLGAQSTAALTITDNDSAPTLSVNDTSVIEGNSGATNATFTVSLSTASGKTVTVNYLTGDNTAVAPGDYTAVASTTLTFNPGETSKTFNVAVVGDTTDEPNEIFFVGLTSPTNATINDGQGEGTINDDDGPPALSINDISVAEGNGGPTTATFTVSLLPASGQSVSVNYATSDGTATTADNDYASTSNTLTFTPGQTSKTITVNVNGDTTPEAHENFFVNLTSPDNATISDPQGQGTINNDDAAFSVNDVSANEGNSGNTAFTFTVSIPHPSVNAVSVNYATSAGGSATAGSDYTSTSGMVNIPAGGTSTTFDVQVTGDTTFENNETFNVTLSGPTSATINDGAGTGTINNDDTAPAFSINNVTVTEGDTGTVTATFNVTLSSASGLASSVNYATANNTAVAPGDYTAITSTALNFAAGETSKPVSVTVNGDTLFEGTETFFVNLSGATGASIADAQGQGTITDNDTQPTLQFGSPTYAVTESGPTATITVTRSGGSNGGVTVNYETTTGGSATAGSDYTATSGTLTFAAGETSKTFDIAINNDTLDETDETVNLLLSSPGGGGALGVQSTATLTITDDDTPPTISIGDATVTEGNTGSVNAAFTVSLSAASGLTVTVNYATANGTAVAPGDYTAVGLTALTFSPGETSKTINVTTLGDSLDETNENFSVNLSGPDNATIADAQGVGTITDDDDAPSISINNAPAVIEGNSGTVNAVFTVTLSAPSGQTVTVGYKTVEGTATAGVDYTEISPSTLTFNPGETSKTINVAVIGDTLDENIETFVVFLSAPTNATLNVSLGNGSITDDDPLPSFSINDVTVTEGNSGTTTATFTVTLSAPSGRFVSVQCSTADGTATTANNDYTPTSATLNFFAGDTTKTFTVNVNGDTVNEANETFFVNLVLPFPTDATIADGQGQATINNDDTPTLRFSQATYPVGESAHFVTITVTRTGDPAPAVGVNFATSDGTATERRDYTAVSGRLQFAAGETSKSFDVLLTEDAYTESEETINLTLSNATGGASLGSQSTATVNIAADDNPPPGVNPIDVSSDFVRQHYHDFLNREPDASGLAFWTGEIEQCGADAGCREVKRINVSAAFFLSIEFQQTGYLVYRTYKAAYGDATSPNVEGTVPVVRLQEFLPDTQSIGEGLVVGPPGWELKLEANKNAYMAEFVQRQRFLTAYPLSLTPTQFVDKLNQNAGGVLDATERQNLINELTANNNNAGRASVLRKVAEDAGLVQQEFTRAFVQMQYFGYLRRNPDDPQDTNFAGWKFWLTKLNESNGNFVNAEMVKAFLDSIEYRTRFAP